MFEKRVYRRKQYYDYSSDGWYFITICTHRREHFFGSVIHKQVVHTRIGTIAEQCWREIPQHYSEARVDEFVVIPDHFHGLLLVDNSKLMYKKRAVIRRRYQTVPVIIGSFKSAVSGRAHQEVPEIPFQWQRSYHDCIIVSPDDIPRIRQYIKNNPSQGMP